MNLYYRADIDGLRAIAVLLVVAFHAFPDLVGGGFVGVDVFFVISGYLITGLILSGVNSSSFGFADFYTRRARRLLPALAAVLTGVLVIGWVLLLPAMYQDLGLHALAGALFFPNLLSWSEVGYFDAAAGTKPLLHLWSLGVEEQFYLAWPLLLVLMSRRRKWLPVALSGIAAASFIYSCYATAHTPAAAFYSPLARLWELAVGGILASTKLDIKKRNAVSLFGIVLIVGSAFVLDKASPFPGALALVPVVGTALVISFGSNLLSSNWPVSVGLISYPLYLWHWPLLSFAEIAGVTSVPARSAIIAASFVLAILTTRLVERPIRFGSAQRSHVAIFAAAAVVLIAGSASVWQSGGVPWRYPAEIRPVLATMKYNPASGARVFRCWLDRASGFENYSGECGVGATLVWGDSHAGRLYAGLKHDGIDVAQFTRDACAPLLGSEDAVCAQSNTAILRRIAELRPKKVILFAAWSNYRIGDPRSELVATLTKLGTLVDDVVVLGPAPFWSSDLPRQVYDSWRANGRLPDRLPPAPLQYREIDRMLAVAASVAAHVRFVSLYDTLCNKDGCLTHTSRSNAELLSWDHGHLTTEGAKFIVALLQLN